MKKIYREKEGRTQKMGKREIKRWTKKGIKKTLKVTVKENRERENGEDVENGE